MSDVGNVASSLISAVSAEQINRQNIGYQQKYNKMQMEREDNAYQRAVLDAQRAGLSPLAVLGTGGAQSQPLTAPQVTQNPAQRGLETFNAMRATQSQIEYNNALTSKTQEDTVGQSISNANSQASYNAKLLKLYEEANNIRVQTFREREFLNEYKQRLLEELKGLKLANEGKAVENLSKEGSKVYNESLGLNPQTSWSANPTSTIGYAMTATKTLAEKKQRDSNNALKDKSNKEALYKEYVAEYDKMYSKMLSDWKSRFSDFEKTLKGKSLTENLYQRAKWLKANPKPKYYKPNKKDFGL